MDKIYIIQDRRLWIAHLPTPYGHMELLCGEGNEPDIKCLILIEQFFDGTTDHIADIRRSVFKFPRLWRPIRFAINNEGRLGLQFMNRITSKQVGLYFADDHSTFTTKLSGINVTDDDKKRLHEKCSFDDIDA